MFHSTIHHRVCCWCTWRQCVSHAEWWRSPDHVDIAARVVTHVARGCRQVSELHLQLVQQRRVHVEQRVGLGVTALQRTQPLVKG